MTKVLLRVVQDQTLIGRHPKSNGYRVLDLRNFFVGFKYPRQEIDGIEYKISETKMGYFNIMNVKTLSMS